MGTLLAADTPSGIEAPCVRRDTMLSHVADPNTPSSSTRSSDASVSETLTPTESPMKDRRFGVVTPRAIGDSSNPGGGNPNALRESPAGGRRGPLRAPLWAQMPSKREPLSGAVAMPFPFGSPYLVAIASASMPRVHVCSGLPGTSSQGSSTAGKEPPAVRGPLDAENSVATSTPFCIRTTVAVSLTALLLSTCSPVMKPADVGRGRVAAPP